jgi:hypothetical protein
MTDQSGLAIHGHDLRPAQHVDPLLRLQGPHQHVDRVAAGGKDEAADIAVGRDPPGAQVAHALVADDAGIGIAAIA